MCRMILLWGNFSDDFGSIFRSLEDVAQDDPLLRKDGKKGSHKDGWGFLNITDDSIEYRRFATPLTLKTSEPKVRDGLAIVHARAAAPGEGLGVLNTHPFHEQDETYDVYISHNGWFDKEGMNDILELETVKSMNDTEVFLRLVMSRKGTIETRVKNALDLSRKNGYIKGGANIYIIALRKATNETTIIFFSDVGPELDYNEFYRLYSITGVNWNGIVSSSLIISDYFPNKIEFSPIERGKIYTRKIDLSNLKQTA